MASTIQTNTFAAARATVTGCNNHAELGDSDSWHAVFEAETAPENIAAVLEELEF